MRLVDLGIHNVLSFGLSSCSDILVGGRSITGAKSFSGIAKLSICKQGNCLMQGQKVVIRPWSLLSDLP
jgi:hypothetical protein